MIKQLKKTKLSSYVRMPHYPTCGTFLSPGIDKHGQPDTGLTLEEEEEFEKLLGLNKGTLKRNSPYWYDFGLMITDRGIKLDDSDPLERLQIKVLQHQSNVSTNLKEIGPTHDFVLYSEVEEAQQNNSKTRVRIEALSKFHSLTEAQKSQALAFYTPGVTYESLDPERVFDRLYLEVEKNPALFLEIINDPNFSIKTFCNQLVAARILKLKSTVYYYENSPIGVNLDAVVDFIKNPENGELVKTWKLLLAESKK